MNRRDHDHEGHGHGRGTSTGRVAVAAGLNVGLAVVQVVVGLALGSVVVLADSLHQVVDAVGLVTALVALAMTRRPPTGTMTYGWGRADALGAYTSALLLAGSVIWVTIEAIGRFFDPVEVEGAGVIAIGLAGVAVNGLGVWILGGARNLSMRAARLHLLVDLAGSVIVVATGVLLSGTGLDWVDPAASLVVNALVVHGTFVLLRSAAAELLDRAPEGKASPDIEAMLLARPEVEAVHHVHTRSLGMGVHSLTAHVVLEGAFELHDAQTELDAIQADLVDKLGIAHTTIQLECHDCEDPAHLPGET